MFYFIIMQLIVSMAAMQPDRVIRPSSARPCSAPSIVEDIVTSFRSDLPCLQSVEVPTGLVARIHVTNRDSYCAALTNDQRSLVQITSYNSSLNFCASEDRAATVASGTHYVRFVDSTIPLRLSIAFLNTSLACHDIISDALIGVPLTLAPTERQCTVIVPSRTVLEIRKIMRTRPGVTDTRKCVRPRMGRTFHSINVRWPAVCEIPSEDTFEYELGCSAALLDASNLDIANIDFILHQMDEYKAVTSPLMCALENENRIV